MEELLCDAPYEGVDLAAQEHIVRAHVWDELPLLLQAKICNFLLDLFLS